MASRAAWLVMVVATALSTSPARAAPKRPTLAVIPLSGDGIAVDGLLRLDAAMRQAASASARAEVVQDELATRRALAAADTLAARCDDRGVECAAKLGSLIGADLVLLAHARKDGAALELLLQVVDVQRRVEVRRVEARLQLEPMLRVDDVPPAVARLLSPQGLVTQLVVAVAPAGAQVEVDGQPAGDGALTGLTLSSGRHVVIARAAGFIPAALTVELSLGEQRHVDLALAPLPILPPVVTVLPPVTVVGPPVVAPTSLPALVLTSGIGLSVAGALVGLAGVVPTALAVDADARLELAKQAYDALNPTDPARLVHAAAARDLVAGRAGQVAWATALYTVGGGLLLTGLIVTLEPLVAGALDAPP